MYGFLNNLVIKAIHQLKSIQFILVTFTFTFLIYFSILSILELSF